MRVLRAPHVPEENLEVRLSFRRYESAVSVARVSKGHVKGAVQGPMTTGIRLRAGHAATLRHYHGTEGNVGRL